MAEENKHDIYVFTKAAVLRSLSTLVKAGVHEHFSGYLAILRARADGSKAAHLADILGFYDRYLKVVDAPEKSPYLQPFRSRGEGLKLFNKNVAGSYAPSSVRAQGKLTSVVQVSGEGREATYALAPDHASQALSSLLKNKKVPVVALIAVLYRDYGFQLEAPRISEVRDLFRREFGLSENLGAEGEVYRTLFSDDSSDFTEADLQIMP